MIWNIQYRDLEGRKKLSRHADGHPRRFATKEKARQYVRNHDPAGLMGLAIVPEESDRR